jgi:ubiquitin related modifier 1
MELSHCISRVNFPTDRCLHSVSLWRLPVARRRLAHKPSRRYQTSHVSKMVHVKIEFVGGMDLLFGGQKDADIDVKAEEGRPVTIVDVMVHCRDHLLTERPELFMKGDTVRPGILVLINDADWELMGTTGAEVGEGDRVVFISTLHGG